MFEIVNIFLLIIISGILLLVTLKKLSAIKAEDNKILPSGRILFFDFVKGLSIFAVVLMHIGYIYYDLNNNQIITYFNLFLLKIFRFAVPFFIISSGFLLSLKDYSLKSILYFYKTKFLRLVLPYLIFCVALYLLNNKDYSIVDFLKKIINGEDILTPYYFMSILIQLYLIYPIASFLMNKFNKLLILFLSFIFSIFCFLFLYKISFFYFFGSFLFFFVLGIFFKDILFKTNIKEVLKSIRFNILFAFIFGIYLLFSIFDYKETYSNYQYVYASCLFLFIFNNYDSIKKMYLHNLFVNIGKHSLYIFLAHYFILTSINLLLISYIPDIMLRFSVFMIFGASISIFIPYGFSIFIDKVKVKLTTKF